MAGAELMKRVICCVQKRYGSWQDHEFPAIYLYSYPFSPMLDPKDWIKSSASIRHELLEAFASPLSQGSSVIGVACNTAHTFLDDLLATDKRFVSILTCIKDELLPYKRVLILGSQTSADMRLHAPSCHAIYPASDDQEIVTRYIVNVLKGNMSGTHWHEFLERCTRTYTPDAILLGCTELSLLPTYTRVNTVPIIDSTDILAERLVTAAYIG